LKSLTPIAMETRTMTSRNRHGKPPKQQQQKRKGLASALRSCRRHHDDTRWDDGESSWNDGEELPPRAMEAPRPLTFTFDDASSIHYGESVTHGVTVALNDGHNHEQEVRVEGSHCQSTVTPIRSGSPKKEEASLKDYDSALLDTLALAHGNSGVEEVYDGIIISKNQHNRHNGARTSPVKNKKSPRQDRGTKGSEKNKEQRKPLADHRKIVERAILQTMGNNADADELKWRPHDDPNTAASEALLNEMSNMSLGSSAGALTSSSMGLSLMSISPPSSESATVSNDDMSITCSRKSWIKTPATMVQESLDRHIRVCIDHCSLSSSSSSPFENLSLPVDMDDLALVATSPDTADKVALKHVAAHDIDKALDVFRVVMMHQKKRILETSDVAAMESEFARTKSRLSVLHLLSGNTREAALYSASALEMHKKAGRQVHATLSTMELGLVYFAEEQLDKALQCWREALQLACLTLGYDHFTVAILLNNMGILRFYLGDISGSIRALEESLGIQRQLLRSDSQSTNAEMPLVQLANTTSTLAIISAKIKNYESAVIFLEEAIAISDSVLTTNTTTRVNSQAEKYLNFFIQLRDKGDMDANNSLTDDSLMTQSSGGTHYDVPRPTMSTLFGNFDGIPLRHEMNSPCHLPRPNLGADHNIYDCLQLGSLVKPATARERIHATITNTLERAVKSSNVDFLKPRASDDASVGVRKKQSIPVDTDLEAVVDAEFHLEQIYFQAMDHLCVSPSSFSMTEPCF